MMNIRTHHYITKCFNWKNLIDKAQNKQFGYTCFPDEADKVCLLLTNTVMQEIDHHKSKSPEFRQQLMELLSENGSLSKAATLRFLEVLGAHQGERLLKETGQEFIDPMSENPNLRNDISLINVALFWNAEIGHSGTVVLVTDDHSLLKMAKQHLLPAITLYQFDRALANKNHLPWTGQVLRLAMPTATKTTSGEEIGKPLATKSDSVLQELRKAASITKNLISTHQRTYVDFSLPYHDEATSVILFGDFGTEQQFVMKKRTFTGGIGISISTETVPDDIDMTDEVDEPDSPKEPEEQPGTVPEPDDLDEEEIPAELEAEILADPDFPDDDIIDPLEEQPEDPKDDPNQLQTPLKQEWWKRISLSPKAYLFKYLIDHQDWFINPQLPVVTDIYGNTSNLIIVPAPVPITSQSLEEANGALERWELIFTQLPNFTRK
jgi:hypothetical protein